MLKFPLTKLEKIINNFSRTRVLVVGDIIMDQYIWGKVSRISPEAPVPVVEIEKETFLPGGSGNVAYNLVSLGGKVFLCGVVGNDVSGKSIAEKISSLGVNIGGIFIDNARPTVQKTRVIAQVQQVVRIDREDKNIISQKIIDNILEYTANIVPQMQAIIISDYGKGIICPPVLNELIRLCRKYDKPVMVDPKVEHFLKYRHVTCLTPNHYEAAGGIHYPTPKTQQEVELLGTKIIKKLHCYSLLITQGEKGMTLFENGKKPVHIPTVAREVFDVTGAGDTVISVLTLAKAAGANLLEAAFIANHAAGIVVGKVGTATCSVDELRQNLKNS